MEKFNLLFIFYDNLFIYIGAVIMAISKSTNQAVLAKLACHTSNDMTKATGGVGDKNSLWVCTAMTFKKVSNVGESPETTPCVFTFNELGEPDRKESLFLESSTTENSSDPKGARE